MKYIMIRPEADNMRINARGDILVGGELYTPREWDAVRVNYHSNPARLDAVGQEVNVSKKRIYWFFGARFPMEVPACTGSR